LKLAIHKIMEVHVYIVTHVQILFMDKMSLKIMWYFHKLIATKMQISMILRTYRTFRVDVTFFYCDYTFKYIQVLQQY